MLEKKWKRYYSINVRFLTCECCVMVLEKKIFPPGDSYLRTRAACSGVCNLISNGSETENESRWSFLKHYKSTRPITKVRHGDTWRRKDLETEERHGEKEGRAFMNWQTVYWEGKVLHALSLLLQNIPPPPSWQSPHFWLWGTLWPIPGQSRTKQLIDENKAPVINFGPSVQTSVSPSITLPFHIFIITCITHTFKHNPISPCTLPLLLATARPIWRWNASSKQWFLAKQ